jgi:predicted Zn-dependent protease
MFMELLAGRGGPGQLARFLADMVRNTPVGRVPAAAEVTRKLGGGDVRGAMAAGRRALAETALGQAERMPGNPEYVMRMGFLFRFAAENAPDWAEAQEKCGNFMMVTADYAGAVRYLGRAWALNPRDPQAGIRLAAALLSGDRFAEATLVLERVVRMAPGEPAAWFYLGQAEYARGRRREAVRAFGQFLALAPASPQAPLVRNLLSSMPADR